ncbi:hypothetical protein NESM_000470300 [Novymonas esmeraldas]|uniref:Uncharacterized protein n=1 Tax=Novymonas esmeraldas TaxID=1808958 RepID=A0AAW0EQD7_9TRYP
MKPAREVLDADRRCVDLSDQRGGLSASVLESLRTFLRYNDRYIHLRVSDNLLGSEAMAELCALIKRHPHLATLEAQHCGLLDKDFRYYVGPAITTMPRITYVDLSRNCGLTDASADTVARILLETEVETMRLGGTSLTEAGGRVIAAAVVNTTALVSCELPFTVGTAVLEEVEECTRRNRAHRAVLNSATAHYTRLRVSRSRLPSLPALKPVEAPVALLTDQLSPLDVAPRPSPATPALDVGPNVGESDMDRQWRACIHKGRKRALTQTESTPPPPSSVSATSAPSAPPSSSTSHMGSSSRRALRTSSTVLPAAPSPTPSPLPSLTRRAKATPNSLEEVTMWDWADPAMSTTLHCLYLLDHQAQVLAQHRTATAATAVPEVPRRSRVSHTRKPNGADPLRLPYL